MNSKELEEKARLERKGAVRAAHQINEELSPGQMIDRYYFGGGEHNFTTFMKRFSEDPVPGALVGAAMAWTTGQDYAARHGVTVESEKEMIRSKIDAGREKLSSSGSDPNKESLTDQAKDQADSVKGQLKSATDKAGEWVSEAKEQGSEALDSAKHAMSDSASHAKDQMRDSGAKIQRQAQDSFRSEPLINVAVGFALGSALGSMIPMTEQEERYLREPAENLSDEVDQQIHQAKQKGSEIAKNIGNTISDSL